MENLTSHRSLQSLEVQYDAATISAPGFKDIDYQHEPYSGDDWESELNADSVQWATETFSVNENANALRWGTLYSYWCDSTSIPKKVKLGLFRPGTTTQVTVDIPEPEMQLTSTRMIEWATVESGANVGNIQSDKPGTFPIACRAKLDRQIASIESSDKNVVVNAKKNGQSDWNIEVSPTENAEDGYFESILTVRTGNESDQPVQVRVYGNIQK